MKSLLTVSLLRLLFLGTGLTAHAQQTKEKTEGTTGQKITLNIKGMVCSMCEKKMKGSLEKLDGVKKVEKVDAEEGIASLWVAANKTVSDGQLKKAVEDAGFKLKKVNRNFEEHSGYSH